MRTINEGYISAPEVCKILGIHRHTLRRWYVWWENPYFEKPDDLYLPPYRLEGQDTTHRHRMFAPEDIEHLKKFHKQMCTTHKGEMSRFNAAKVWNKRGDEPLRNKGIDPEQERMKLYKNYRED